MAGEELAIERVADTYHRDFDLIGGNHLRLEDNATFAPGLAGQAFWVATERWPLIQAVWPDARCHPTVAVPAGVRGEWSREDAILHQVRGRVRELTAKFPLPY